MRRRVERVTCPVPGCCTEIPRTWLMCRPHWMSCAPANRRDHQRLWKDYKRAAGGGHPEERYFAITAFRRSCDERIAEATEKARAS